MESYIKHILFEAFAVTCLTFKHEVCHELHFHIDDSRTLAFLASSAFRVE